MDKEALPPETVRLIRSHIESVGQLEILLLLHAARDTAFTPNEINESLRSNIDSVEQRLASLVNSELVVRLEGVPKRYQYGPSNPDQARAVDRLAQSYITHRVRVIELLYSPPDRMQSFSDAFRIKKERDDG